MRFFLAVGNFVPCLSALEAEAGSVDLTRAFAGNVPRVPALEAFLRSGHFFNGAVH